MARRPNPYLTDEENPELEAGAIAHGRPAKEILPSELYEALTRRRDETVSVTLDIDRSVVERFQSTGPNWRERMNEALKKASGR
ncbi:MAG: BrnA antitoxin family protein [Alphaproteobacteria bacterium]|nr:BrnA antitoxin family protein [Alphaproteobacteria bacterium]MBM3624013.1 BrnA antitoxin family protein [Alphaproteobacteria bacterium]